MSFEGHGAESAARVDSGERTSACKNGTLFPGLESKSALVVGRLSTIRRDEGSSPRASSWRTR